MNLKTMKTLIKLNCSFSLLSSNFAIHLEELLLAKMSLVSHEVDSFSWSLNDTQYSISKHIVGYDRTIMIM